ncbi:iron-containing alcohol dehydrogenase family protein [Cyanobacteria bacterium FACHB-502]|nr:iron-containing alcohol dehydrogenase family protein [Cyanobacteria bacterium FACHB-502]
MTDSDLSLPVLTIAPAQVARGTGILAQMGSAIARFGQRFLVIGGDRSLAVMRPLLEPIAIEQGLALAEASYGRDCSEAGIAALRQAAADHQAEVIMGVGGGKALDAAKLVAHQCNLPIVTIPTSGATCAAWTALSNVYSDEGAFLYDVPLPHCPNLLILDYSIVETASRRTLVAGIGDALAKWYEASVSSGHSDQTLIIGAVQQARVLRDLLLQKSIEALKLPGSAVWREVVDASVLMAGVIGGMGGAQCRTVAAHAVHNGLTHLLQSHGTLHGEKVAFGILVQLRLEEMVQGSILAATSRQQLLKFYGEIGLPQTLADLGLINVTLADLQRSAEIACRPSSDIHRLPFTVTPDQLMAAMVSTTAPSEARNQSISHLRNSVAADAIDSPSEASSVNEVKP